MSRRISGRTIPHGQVVASRQRNADPPPRPEKKGATTGMMLFPSADLPPPPTHGPQDKASSPISVMAGPRAPSASASLARSSPTNPQVPLRCPSGSRRRHAHVPRLTFA